MDDFVFPLILALDVQSLTMSLVNIASPVGHEGSLADSVEGALRALVHLDVERVGDTVTARTNAGHSRRVIVAGRLDVASTREPLAYVEMGKLFGPGASNAKGALAVTLKAAAIGSYQCDVTFVYSGGERNLAGLTGDLHQAEVILLAEPTNSAVRAEALDEPWTRRLIELTDAAPMPRLPRLASVDVPVVAFGPGDPSLAGQPDEFVPTAQLTQCEYVLRQWLTA